MTRYLPALALLLATTAARADVGVVVTGEATLQPQLASQLEGWLKARGHKVFASPLEPDAINTLIDCFVIEDMNCARKVVETRAKSDTIIYARVEMAPESDGSRNVSIVGYWLTKGHETIAERRICHACTDTAIHTTADDLMHALAAEPPVSNHVSDPTKPGAPIAGATDASTTYVEDQPSKLVPAIVLGAGAALVITGGVLVAIDQDVSPMGFQASGTYRDTATGGVVCIGLGVAAVAAGAYLWFSHGSSAPVAAVTHDGATIGWAGRF